MTLAVPYEPSKRIPDTLDLSAFVPRPGVVTEKVETPEADATPREGQPPSSQTQPKTCRDTDEISTFVFNRSGAGSRPAPRSMELAAIKLPPDLEQKPADEDEE